MKEQALKEADDAKKRTKTSEKSEHNTDHKNERSPNNSGKAKQRAGGSPKKLPPAPPFPNGGGEKASGNQDKPKYDNPESKHEPKGNPGRPSITQPSHNRAKKKQIQRNTKSKSKTKPKT